jgi:hypothetical protein
LGGRLQTLADTSALTTFDKSDPCQLIEQIVASQAITLAKCDPTSDKISITLTSETAFGKLTRSASAGYKNCNNAKQSSAAGSLNKDN